MNAARMPIIRRTRGWRLYGLDGSRFLDLYSDGGKTLLGRKNSGMGTLAKACIDTGLISEFESVWTGRFEKALKAWLPFCNSIFLFPSFTEARTVLAAALVGQPDSTPKVAMAFGEYRLENARTSIPRKIGAQVVVELPLPALWSFGIVAAAASADTQVLGDVRKAEAESSGIPALKLALATRALAELAACKETYDEKHWSTMDPFIEGLFTRSGPWLYPAYGESEHERIFGECLSKGILISPHYAEPSLVPGEFDQGEVSVLKTIAGRAMEA